MKDRPLMLIRVAIPRVAPIAPSVTNHDAKTICAPRNVKMEKCFGFDCMIE